MWNRLYHIIIHFLLFILDHGIVFVRCCIILIKLSPTFILLRGGAHVENIFTAEPHIIVTCACKYWRFIHLLTWRHVVFTVDMMKLNKCLFSLVITFQLQYTRYALCFEKIMQLRGMIFWFLNLNPAFWGLIYVTLISNFVLLLWERVLVKKLNVASKKNLENRYNLLATICVRWVFFLAT